MYILKLTRNGPKLAQLVCKLLCVAVIYLGLVCPFWAQALQTVHAAADAPKKILFIPSYNFNYLGIQWFNKGFMSEMDGKNAHNISYSMENLQLATHSGDEAYFKAMAESLRIKYATDKPDLIVAQYKQSFTFLHRYGQQIFGDVPVVFAGLELERYGDIKIPAHFTGITTSFNAKQNIDLILRLHPQTQTIYVINGAGLAEREMLASTLAQGLQYQDRLKFVALSQLPFDQMLARVAEIRGDAAILYLSMQLDVAGRVLVPAAVARDIAAAAKAPVYGMLDTYEGSGITGGFLISHEKLGRRAADIARSILQGQAPTGNFSNEPIGENFFDWRQLKRWGIDEDSLPADSRIEFKEFSVWETYKWRLIGGLCFIILQSLLVILLLINRSRRKRAEEALLEANENLEHKVITRTQELDKVNESLTAQNEEIITMNEELEQRVAERTADLAGANQELVAQYDELKQSQEAQRLSNILLEQTFEQSPVPMVLVSMPGAIFRFVNPACRKLLRIDETRSLIGTSLRELKPAWQDLDMQGRDASIKELPLARSLMGIRTEGEERRIVHKDGTISCELVSGTPILDDAGKVIAGYLVMMDVTERMRRAQEIGRDAQIATRMQNALLSVPGPSDYIDIATVYNPIGYVGGDLYFLDWRYEGNLLRGFLVDATGHGLGTALHTASLHVLLREVNERDLSLADAMRWLNRRAEEYFEEDSFAGALGFEIDLQTRQLHWVCAGIPEMWMYTKMKQGVVECPGMCLGIRADETFETHTISVDIGDSLYFMTDGLADLLDGRSELPLERYPAMVGLLRELSAAENRRDDARQSASMCARCRNL